MENYRPDAQMTVILPSTPGKLEPLTPPPVLDAANDPLETIILDKPSHAPASKPPVSPAHALPSTPPLAPAAHTPSPVLPANSAPAQEARPAGQRATPNAGTILPVLQTEVLEPGAVDAALQARQAAAPTPAGAPQNRNAAPKSPPTRKQATSRAPVAAKQAATFSIVVGTASVVLLAVAVGFYLYTTRTTKAPTADTLPPVAMSIPVVAASKPAPPPVQSEPVAPVLAVAAVSEAPAIQPTPVVEVAASAPPSVVTVDLTQAATPHMLKEAEITALLKDLKKRRPPEDCDGASRMLVSDHNVLPKQAGRIAKRAYPDLCAPAPKPTTDIASTIQRTPVQESAPPPAVAKARTLDEQYEERIGSECSKGAFGYVCREAMRVKLCGKLVENPPAGQSICKQ
ncbi:hypothetical protein [Uliginosibacterium gangwonense]|uniref:hypothetical protein n=1 Tax=Uliginosibacterium gangwonense TaxID=392736 RepID=UPI0012FA46BC|nr:hypothetical protein [Uliginosibacterium gangwonense]